MNLDNIKLMVVPYAWCDDMISDSKRPKCWSIGIAIITTEIYVQTNMYAQNSIIENDTALHPLSTPANP